MEGRRGKDEGRGRGERRGKENGKGRGNSALVVGEIDAPVLHPKEKNGVWSVCKCLLQQIAEVQRWRIRPISGLTPDKWAAVEQKSKKMRNGKPCNYVMIAPILLFYSGMGQIVAEIAPGAPKNGAEN